MSQRIGQALKLKGRRSCLAPFGVPGCGGGYALQGESKVFVATWTFADSKGWISSI